MAAVKPEPSLHSSKTHVQYLTLHHCAQFPLNFDDVCSSWVIGSSVFHRTSLLELFIENCEKWRLVRDGDDNPGDTALDIDREGIESGDNIKLLNICAIIRMFVNHQQLRIYFEFAESGLPPPTRSVTSQHSCVQGREPFATREM